MFESLLRERVATSIMPMEISTADPALHFEFLLNESQASSKKNVKAMNNACWMAHKKVD